MPRLLWEVFFPDVEIRVWYKWAIAADSQITKTITHLQGLIPEDQVGAFQKSVDEWHRDIVGDTPREQGTLRSVDLNFITSP